MKFRECRLVEWLEYFILNSRIAITFSIKVAALDICHYTYFDTIFWLDSVKRFFQVLTSYSTLSLI